MNILHLVTILAILLEHEVTGAIQNTEQKLLEFLFKNYDWNARPVLNISSAINVTFGVEIINLIKVHDRDQFITNKVWVRQKWRNELLTWDPKDWGGVKTVQVDGSMVWTPDTVLYNNAADQFTGGTEKYKTRIQLNHDGLTSWNSPSTFVSTCKIDIRYFPFDRQECKLKFGSWTYDKAGINLMADERPLLTSQYVNSSEWEIVKSEGITNEIVYACCEVPFIDVTFTIIILRKPLYFVFNVILPCIVLVTTILFGFFLPPESGERISLTITILLAVAVFLQLISDTLPRNSESIPILSTFYMVVMAESAMSLIATCIVLLIYYRNSETDSTQMPKWMKKLFLIQIAPILGVPVTLYQEEAVEFNLHHNNMEHDNAMFQNHNGYLSGHNNGKSVSKNSRNIDNDVDSNVDNGYIMEKMLAENLKRRNNVAEKSTLTAILSETKMIMSSIRSKHKHEELVGEWRCLAKVVDRIFFWVFLMTVILTSVGILVPAYLVNH